MELKIRSADFETRTRSRSLAEATNTTEVIWRVAAALLEKSLSPDILPLRLLGVGATHLSRSSAVQGQLFGAETGERQSALDTAIDAIRGEFGTAAIQRGSRLDGVETRQQDTRET